jgi:phage baseplate assembly protein W
MASFGVALPIQRDSADGFRMLKNFRKLIQQNLKMLVLTNPGERVMEPGFGVGIRTLLFENYNIGAFEKARTAINEQTAKYMPAVKVVQVLFDDSAANQDRNTLGIQIYYAVPDIGMTEMLQFTI